MARTPPLRRLQAPYHQLLLALTVQLVILGLAPPAWIQQGSNFVLTAWMSWATVSITWRRGDFWVALFLGCAPAVTTLAVPPDGHTVPLLVTEQVLWIAFPAFLAYRIFAPLYRSREVGGHELSGAVTVLLLLGIGFANVQELIFTLNPGSVVFANLAPGAAPDFGDFLYFSFVTLATVGYGDASPTLHISRLVAVLEALAGLLYVAIIVARLVAMQTVPPLDARD